MEIFKNVMNLKKKGIMGINEFPFTNCNTTNNYIYSDYMVSRTLDNKNINFTIYIQLLLMEISNNDRDVNLIVDPRDDTPSCCIYLNNNKINIRDTLNILYGKGASGFYLKIHEYKESTLIKNDINRGSFSINDRIKTYISRWYRNTKICINIYKKFEEIKMRRNIFKNNLKKYFKLCRYSNSLILKMNKFSKNKKLNLNLDMVITNFVETNVIIYGHNYDGDDNKEKIKNFIYLKENEVDFFEKNKINFLMVFSIDKDYPDINNYQVGLLRIYTKKNINKELHYRLNIKFNEIDEIINPYIY